VVVPDTVLSNNDFPTKLMIEGVDFDRCSVSKDNETASYRCGGYRRHKCFCRANYKSGEWITKGQHNEKCNKHNVITKIDGTDGNALNGTVLDVTDSQRLFVEHLALNEISYSPTQIYDEMLKAWGELSTVTKSLKRSEVRKRSENERIRIFEHSNFLTKMCCILTGHTSCVLCPG
jgi:hypothetical protein